MNTSSNVIVCIKWAPPDSSADSATDDRFAGISFADRAALELGLRTSDTTGDDLVVLTVGPFGADKILREALASGAARAIRIDSPGDVPSVEAAAAVARVLGTLENIRLIWCGDYSPDRGSGSFPAFLAAHMDLDQSLGLIRVDFPATGAFPLEVVRRLDGGRRERSLVDATAVLSVEGSLARLRRASLSRTLAAQTLPIEVVTTDIEACEATVLRPYKPRTRTIAAPMGDSLLDRIRAVTETSNPKGSSDPVELDPLPAAEMIVRRLREWGYVQ